MRSGVPFGLAAFLLWGLFPIYWKAVDHVPSLELLLQRTAWSFLSLLPLLVLRGDWKWIGDLRRRPRSIALFAATSVLLAINWFTFIWAVNNGRVVDASLGYFINPLVNVALGYLFLRERLRRWQRAAIAIAALGILQLLLAHGDFPWAAIVLALSFGLYGLLRKIGALGALEGLSLETAILFLPAVAGLLWMGSRGNMVFANGDRTTDALLVLSGIVTAVPLLLFAAAAKRATLATVGMMQYLAPTLHLLLGLFLYGEVMTPARLLAFVSIWLALGIYTAEGLVASRQASPRLTR